MTNQKEQADNLWSESFRLLVDGASIPPANALNELVAAGSTSQREVVFVFDDAAERLVLLVGDGQDKTRIPLDLTR